MLYTTVAVPTFASESQVPEVTSVHVLHITPWGPTTKLVCVSFFSLGSGLSLPLSSALFFVPFLSLDGTLVKHLMPVLRTSDTFY